MTDGARDRAVAWWAGGVAAVVIVALVTLGLLTRGDDTDCDPGDRACEQADAGDRAPGPKATATPTPSPTPEPDRPGPETTGVPAGVTLVPHPGAEPGKDSLFLADDGLVLDGVHIAGDVILAGNGQALRNSRVDGKVTVRGSGSVVSDSEIGSLSVSGATTFAAQRVEVFGAPGEDGIHVTSGTSRTADVVIEDSWIHSPQVLPGSHYDGIQVRGVDRLTLRGNVFDLGEWNDRYNAAIFLEDANGGNIDVVVEGNWVNGGGYSVYAFGTDVRFVGNRFGPDSRWGLLYPEHMAFEQSGNVWADSGAPVELE